MSDTVDAFIDRWKPSSGSEMANFQTFANELTDLLAVERPKPATSDGENNDYRFERPVTFTHTGRNSRGRIDLYKHGCFILEAKQGGDRASKDDQDQLKSLLEKDAPKAKLGHGPRGTAKWDDTMLKARNQADGYARAVSKEDGWPPFLIIVDVGHVFELYADFSRAGQGYTQFPDGNRYRITLEDLRKEETRNLLQTIWTDPQSLDPSLVAAKVTREIATHLAKLGNSFEEQGHDSETVARFLMRCLFSMFAEDVELIPKHSFTNKLIELRGHPEHAAPTLKALWETMNKGGFSTVLITDLKRFNGGLFKEADALPLNNLQLGLLIEAAEADWKQVEPAIFGTLLERALDKRQRHKLGAHYTPRSYVERLVTPTIMEPLRADWKDVQTAVQRLMSDGKEANARAAVHEFRRKLCGTKVLDPACGSGNFLYVALEMMKRLEGEVTALLTELGEDQTSLGLSGHTVDPHQFLGIELNPWAANVAELVLWIGYLQWHFRTHGTAAPSEPVLKDFKNIENRDAVLEWSDRTPRMDDQGQPVTRWDGVTTITDSLGNEVPDKSARVQMFTYEKPKAALWPEADFIVGNPPFIGKLKMREDLGDGYVEALRKSYLSVPDSADFVMYWWHKAAQSVQKRTRNSKLGARRFGMITTRAAKQTFNVRVIQAYTVDPKNPISIVYAVPDHPWVDTVFAAKVRIAMSVVATGKRTGVLHTSKVESRALNSNDGWAVSFDTEVGTIRPNLRLGADILAANSLIANRDLCSMGFATGSRGFFLSPKDASFVPENEARYLRKILSAHEITKQRRERFVIDAWEFENESELRSKAPWIYQLLKEKVYPKRSENNDPKLRREWWRFRRSNHDYRTLKIGLTDRFIVAPETSKHRLFILESIGTDVEHGAYGIGLSDADFSAILSGRIHDVWALAQGGDLGATPRYNKTRCFDPFPFPNPTTPQKDHLRTLGEELNTHRKRQQAAHPKLTLTQMYNVLEKLRAGDTIEGKDKGIYDHGLIRILRDLHDQIDAAVADAYGWPVNLPDEDILFRLVDLNKQRATEEAAGHIRWLRPDYQNPEGKQAESKGKQVELEVDAAVKIAKEPWPKALPEQIAAVREALQDLGEASPEQIARRFQRARTTNIEPLLASLAALGQAEKTEDGRYAA